MSQLHSSENSFMDENRGDMLSALFAQLVLQQANMAMMLLGKVAHPETGEVIKDIEAAKLFIDQLEMLEVKTKGNLTRQEAGLLKQSLMSLRLAFVETLESPQPKGGSAPQTGAKPTAPPTAEPQPSPAPAPEEEHHKKFTKKY